MITFSAENWDVFNSVRQYPSGDLVFVGSTKKIGNQKDRKIMITDSNYNIQMLNIENINGDQHNFDVAIASNGNIGVVGIGLRRSNEYFIIYKFKCPAGEFHSHDNKCSNCLPGSANPSEDSQCVQCGTDHYQNLFGQEQCLACSSSSVQPVLWTNILCRKKKSRNATLYI